MALSDLQVYSEYAHSAFTEVDMQNTAAFNEAANQYNLAIRAFPASMMAKGGGFAPVGSLSRMAEPR